MEFELDDQAGEFTILVRGSISVDSANELRDTLRSLSHREPDSVTIDLTDVPFIDSSGLGILLGMRQDLGDKGIALLLRNPQDRVTALLRLTKLGSLFGMED